MRSISQHTATQVMIALQLAVAIIVVITEPLTHFSLTISIAAGVTAIIFGVLLWLHRRNWTYTGPVSAIVTMVTISASLILDAPNTAGFSPVFFVGPVVAGIVAGPILIAAVPITSLVAITIALGVANPYTEPFRLVILALIIAGLVVTRLIVDAQRAQLAQEAARANAEAAASAAQAAEYADLAARASAQAAELQRTLELVGLLEVPTVTLADGVLLAPLIGQVDQRRIEQFTSRLLATLHAQRTRLVLIDLAGVTILDTAVADALRRSMQAVRLLGVRVVITSIPADLAATLTTMGVDWSAMVSIARSPQEALAAELRMSVAQN
ncbi:STAS domain-containing protein [Oscillochloris sp. ZM17-4]|uniref:STAS domain-containing protein n=1 Tax=Oscillochloris sp. ZM17-4 TaxID=2866714 RepID=UPI001C739FC7|nr:STAS domain-containing protein [Oscillochloris sp. ZM17-4]MBX0326472.1 STAS domain-containing protein [Oscillochloris sp. ZM17-4]